MRYIHKWHTPVVVIVHNEPENWYYAPAYNPKHVPTVELDNALAMPYKRCMPQVKKLLLEWMS